MLRNRVLPGATTKQLEHEQRRWLQHCRNPARCFSVLLVVLIAACCCCVLAYKFCRSAFDAVIPSRRTETYYDDGKYDETYPPQSGYGQQSYPMQPYPQQQQQQYPQYSGQGYPAPPPQNAAYPPYPGPKY